MTGNVTPREWVAANCDAEARHDAGAGKIAAREQALTGAGRPVRLAEIRDAHGLTVAEMAKALRTSEDRVKAIETGGLTRATRDAVRDYLSVLVLRLEGSTACYGGTRIPLA